MARDLDVAASRRPGCRTVVLVVVALAAVACSDGGGGEGATADGDDAAKARFYAGNMADLLSW